jgi:ADP-heptose:LPS heptosyltransferase
LIKLTETLQEKGFDVVAIGKDSSETGFFHVQKPVFNLQTTNLINLLNKTSISDCWHLINGAECFVTMDSGLMHLAGTTNTSIVHLGSSIIPEFRIPWRNGVQGYKHSYVHGTCPLFCASDMKYGIREWGDIQGVPPLIRCLENKPTYECHPSVEKVIDVIFNTI